MVLVCRRPNPRVNFLDKKDVPRLLGGSSEGAGKGRTLKHILMFLCVALLFFVPHSLYAQRRQVRVTAAQASVYDAPRANALVLGQLPRGKLLQATGRTQGDWLEIEAPPEISGWIFGELLAGDVVEATTVRIRSGAGVGYEGLGNLVRGDRIDRRGSQGGWIEFAGVPAMRIWIERSMVSAPAAVDLTATPPRPAPPPEPVPEPPREPVRPSPPQPRPEPSPPPPAPVPAERPAPPRPAPSPAPVPEAPLPRPQPVPVPTRDPAPVQRRTLPVPRVDREIHVSEAKKLLPPGFRLVRQAPQGENVQLQGVIRPVGFGLFRPAAYRLVADGPFPTNTQAYLISDTTLLGRAVGRRATISGMRFWLMGAREPVIVVQSLRVSP